MIQDNSATFPPSNTPVVDQRNNLTTSWMGFFRALFNRTGMGTGIPFQLQQIDSSSPSFNVTADWVFVSGALPAAGPIVLPDLSPGQFIVVQTVSGLTIACQAGVTIDGTSTYSLGSNKMQIFWCFTTTQIFS